MEFIPIFLALLATIAFVSAEPVGECPAQSRPTALLPDSESCTKYYVCFKSFPRPAKCRKGQEFNAETSKCEPAEQANCVRPLPTPTEVMEPSPCALVPSFEAFFPHETDCGKYYQCLEGEQYERECPEGLHFNGQSSKCEDPADAECQ
jgi:Chitin binding Peritrophin-A domain